MVDYSILYFCVFCPPDAHCKASVETIDESLASATFLPDVHSYCSCVLVRVSYGGDMAESASVPSGLQGVNTTWMLFFIGYVQRVKNSKGFSGIVHIVGAILL